MITTIHTQQEAQVRLATLIHRWVGRFRIKSGMTGGTAGGSFEMAGATSRMVAMLSGVIGVTCVILLSL